jgi:hypothetical protein
MYVLIDVSLLCGCWWSDRAVDELLRHTAAYCNVELGQLILERVGHLVVVHVLAHYSSS